jgi:hypothetical protein
MVSEMDRYRSEKLVIDQHGPEAGEHAFRMMWRFLHQGDFDGADAWLAIGSAIEDLQNLPPATRRH